MESNQLRIQKISPFLWFDNNAEEAMHFYTSVFKDSEAGEVRRFKDSGPLGNETIISVSFRLFDQQFMAINGGPHFKFSPATSFFVRCENQQEVDEYWAKLSEGGKEDRCGWLTDKFGLSWQIVPDVLGRMLQDPDPEKAKRVMHAMLQMYKIDIDELQKAYQEPE